MLESEMIISRSVIIVGQEIFDQPRDLNEVTARRHRQPLFSDISHGPVELTGKPPRTGNEQRKLSRRHQNHQYPSLVDTQRHPSDPPDQQEGTLTSQS